MDHGGSKFISEDRSDLRGHLNWLNHGASLSLSAGFSFRAGSCWNSLRRITRLSVEQLTQTVRSWLGQSGTPPEKGKRNRRIGTSLQVLQSTCRYFVTGGSQRRKQDARPDFVLPLRSRPCVLKLTAWLIAMRNLRLRLDVGRRRWDCTCGRT
jgi:hypothetical protein